jgi:hypothetical protein
MSRRLAARPHPSTRGRLVDLVERTAILELGLLRFLPAAENLLAKAALKS